MSQKTATRDFDHQLADWILAALTAVIRELSSNKAVIREIRLRRTGPANNSEYRRVMGHSVRFAADADEILLESGSLAIPIALADPVY